MSHRIKMIWDFHGPNSKPIAEHHIKHLDEFVRLEGIKNTFSLVEKISSMHHSASLIVAMEHMNSLREKLKPHRGQNYIEK